MENQESRTAGAPQPAWLEKIFGTLLFGVGAFLGLGGLWLAILGGTLYYLITGLALAAAGVLLFRRNVRAFAVFALTYLGTVVWSLCEAGWNFWPSVPRIGPFIVMAIIMALFWGRIVPGRRKGAWIVALSQVVLGLVGIGAMFVAHDVVRGEATPFSGAYPNEAHAWEWRSYGGDAGANHFVPFSQINAGNVSGLQPAWTFRTGEIDDSPDMEATPIQVGDSLYFCTAHNRVFSLNAETGKKNWTFDPHVDAKGTWNRCRGVAYFDGASHGGTTAEGDCAHRIIATTVDARLFALDAKTGKLCSNFGNGGFVDLTAGLGKLKPGWYYPTSAPLVARGRVIVGGWISDNQSLKEPGGVVRAFDAATGKLAWAWDPGAPEGKAGTGTQFTPATPNFWGTATFDDKLGYVFVPTGNGASDHWGGKRSAATDAYSTSVIALDIETGKRVWNYQTVHHDLWDYDLSAPPTFVDMPQPDGSTIPALVQVGKAGQIFVLDRRTGKPVTKVVERGVSQDAMPDDRVSATQPRSVGMPQVIPQIFSEKTMWGLTFFDQLACRIAFRQLHYEGQFTPPSLQDTAISPGYLGGMNWGGVAIDPIRKLLLVNDIRVATIVRLVPRDQVGDRIQANFSHAGYEMHPNEGTPYAVELKSFNSPLGLPCEQPPWGKITAINLKDRTIAWQLPAGTAREQTANMIGLEIPFQLGMPTISSGLMTASGLTFYAGANDPYLRAWDSSTGKELWQARMPVGSQATPMSYISPKSGRQFVVVDAGGTPYSSRKGDYIVAYALPSKTD